MRTDNRLPPKALAGGQSCVKASGQQLRKLLSSSMCSDHIMLKAQTVTAGTASRLLTILLLSLAATKVVHAQCDSVFLCDSISEVHYGYDDGRITVTYRYDVDSQHVDGSGDHHYYRKYPDTTILEYSVDPLGHVMWAINKQYPYFKLCAVPNESWSIRNTDGRDYRIVKYLGKYPSTVFGKQRNCMEYVMCAIVYGERTDTVPQDLYRILPPFGVVEVVKVGSGSTIKVQAIKCGNTLYANPAVSVIERTKRYDQEMRVHIRDHMLYMYCDQDVLQGTLLLYDMTGKQIFRSGEVVRTRHDGAISRLPCVGVIFWRFVESSGVTYSGTALCD